MEEDNKNECVPEDMNVDEESHIETPVDSAVVPPTLDPEQTVADPEASQMEGDLSSEGELQIIEDATSYSDENQVLLSTDDMNPESALSLQPEEEPPDETMENEEDDQAASQGANAQSDLPEDSDLQNKVGEQCGVLRENRQHARDIKILKIMSDEAWRKEERSHLSEPSEDSVPTSSAIPSIVQTCICAGFALWRNEIRKHFETYPGEYEFEHICNKCGRIFFHDFHEEDQIQISHSQPICAICNKATDEDYIRKHGNRYNDQPHICQVCCRLITHLTIHELEEQAVRTFSCSYCAKSFTDPFLYRNHVKNHREHPYKCSLCGQYYLSRYSMGDHIRTHIRNGSFVANMPLVERANPPSDLFLRF